MPMDMPARKTTPATSGDSRFEQLEATAAEVIQHLQSIPEFSHLLIVVIGGLAVQKHTDPERATKSIDFLITDPGAPNSIRAGLLSVAGPHAGPTSTFDWYLSGFKYHSSKLGRIVVRFFSSDIYDYTPDSAECISNIPRGHVPYIGVVDLLAFKIWSYELRVDEMEEKDVTDIRSIFEYHRHKTWPVLNQWQRKALEEGLPALEKFEDIIDFAQEELLSRTPVQDTMQ